MLEVLRFSPSVKVALIMTSDKCYDNKISNRPHIEDDPMGGIDPYSASVFYLSVYPLDAKIHYV